MADRRWREGPVEQDVTKRASPAPAPITDKEREQIADAQKRGREQREAMRAAGFGDHKGSEGF